MNERVKFRIKRGEKLGHLLEWTKERRIGRSSFYFLSKGRLLFCWNFKEKSVFPFLGKEERVSRVQKGRGLGFAILGIGCNPWLFPPLCWFTFGFL